LHERWKNLEQNEFRLTFNNLRWLVFGAQEDALNKVQTLDNKPFKKNRLARWCENIKHSELKRWLYQINI
jgi:hypothetical protein